MKLIHLYTYLILYINLPSSLCMVSTSESSVKSDTGSGGESPTSLEKRNYIILTANIH